MSAITVTYDYVYFAGGPGRTRQPRSMPGPGGFTLLNQLSGTTLQSGDTFTVGAQPASIVVANVTYSFSFTNVSGGIPAGQTTPSGVTSFTSGTPPPAVTAGSTPIVVLVVYVPLGGGGESGASIDSFDETTGQLFSDTFVTVSPDPGGPPPPLTTSGNVNGFVATANATETMTALSPTSPTGVVFEEWVNLYSEQALGITIMGTELTVNKGMSVYALAFYKANPDPCAAIRAELADLSPGDFSTPGAYAKAREGLVTALVKCEEAHGEVPNPQA